MLTPYAIILPMNNVSSAILSSIREGKWLYVEYDNRKEGRHTFYWLSVNDIKGKKEEDALLMCRIYNPSKGQDTLKTTIRFKNIVSASILTWTTYEVPLALIDKVNNHLDEYPFLKGSHQENAVLAYLERCAALNNDPSLDSSILIEGIDLETLKEAKEYRLDEEQIKKVIELIYKNDPSYKDKTQNECNLVINLLSIDQGERQYLVAYQYVRFSPSEKSLRLAKEINFNPTFIHEGYRSSINNYYDGGSEEFIARFSSDYEALIGELKETLLNKGKGEVVNTRPSFSLLKRDYLSPYPSLVEKLSHELGKGRASSPIKAFFGQSFSHNRSRRPEIVTYSRPDLKQLLLIYNAMRESISYVQGPPGTGKTRTIFNLLLSLYFSGETALVSTYNNRPIDDLSSSFEHLKDYTPNREGASPMKIPFPYLRVGNIEANIEASKRIHELASYPFKGKANKKMLDEMRPRLTGKNASLVDLLARYEAREETETNIEELTRFLSKVKIEDKSNLASLENLLTAYKEKLKTLPEVSNDEIEKVAYIAEEDYSCLSYLYYSSLHHLSLLKRTEYQDLLKICEDENDDARGRAFTSWLRDDGNMALLSKVFPIIFVTNLSSWRLGKDFLFDMVIIDEAGQCDMANSLFPLSKGKRALLVGDPKQLRPIIVIDPSVHEKLKEKYHINDKFDFAGNSLISHMMRVDEKSKRVILTYHYRSAKKIIAFSNARYYQGELDLSKIKDDGEISLFNCPCDKTGAKRNTSLPEAKGIVEYLKKNRERYEGRTIAIFSPFVDQVELINLLLDNAGITDVKASTIHASQGAEADIVLFSSAVSQRTSRKTYEWLKNNEEIINVATSRGKKEFFIFADRDSIARLSEHTRKEESERDDLFALVQYAEKEGNVSLIPQKDRYAHFPKSNGSEAEDEFAITISHLLSIHSSFKVERDISIAEVFPKSKKAKEHSSLYADSVIYRKGGFFGNKWMPAYLFEVAGGEHYERSRNDMLKAEIAKENGCRYVMVDNASVKDYELLSSVITLLSASSKEREKSMARLLEQGSLFEMDA